ncbi:hypothetical protein SADUNF_Sadunf15G0077600 [Salix dunnii]|uniref:Probable Ufm1-specific protease n=1 Tax=Salix dunnii TaxID=1413687 RepID=A0A835JD46_9ROSI|nr:hypothetical protein SADUNF_Sadunf15G0077600 [Salix dunnii]
MADGRRHSVDIPITKTLIALRRVRSLRDPSTNSMSKFSALLENSNWETNPTKDISLMSANGSKEGGSNHNRLSGWKNLGHDGQSKQQVDNFDSGSEFEKSRLIFCDSLGGVKNMDALFRTKKVEGLDSCMEEINGTKSLSEAYYGSHRNKELDLACITPSSNHLEYVDSTNGPIAGSPLGESTDQSVTRRKSRYKNQVQSYGGVGDILSRVGSPCFSVSDALSSQGTSLFANEEADFMVQKDHGCGISCCWTRTPRLRDSNPCSDAEGNPLLLAETSPCGKRRWKHATNETPRSLSHKFRPKSFDELVGQGVVVRSLLGAISRGRITSLYLFHGPHGTGKTSASKIFAAALNCLSLEDCKPCGLCRECYMFFSGRSRDVKEVDSVRINRTERIRSLIKDASVPPISSRFKVFIVDECHLLHGDTWAIVLNSLEKLSENVVFVMVTPELDMLPKSAVTRSHKYHFPKVKEADIANRLRNICVEEALDFDQVALDFIAAKSSGSLRGAEIMLDQLSLLGKRITMTMVHELIGVVSDDELLGLLDLALSSDTSSTVIRARELMRSRIDPMQLVSQLANLIMDVLAGKCKDDSSESRRKFSRKHSSEGDMQRLSRALKILSESEKQLRMSRNQSTWLTAALLQLSSLEASALDVNDSKSSIRNGRERGQDVSHKPRLRNGNFSSTPSTGESLKHLALYSCEDRKLQKSQVQGDCQATLDTIWKRASELCHSNSLRNFLRKQGKLSSLHINRGLAVAELEFHHSDYASKAEKSWKHIASLLQTILGCNVEIRINLVLCAPPASKCAKLWKQSFYFFSCSRRMRRKSQPPMERGIDSDNSDNNSERPMIRERGISACLSGCRSQISHNCYPGVEVARALRNSEGNVLSIGTTSSLRSLNDDTSKTPGNVLSSSRAGGNDLDYSIFYSQEAEDQPNCFPKSPRLQKMLRSSENTQVVCADDLRTLLIKGFDIIGGLIAGVSSSDDGEKNAREVIVWARKLRDSVTGGGGGVNLENRELIGAVAGLSGGDVKFFVERKGNVTAVDSVVYEENQEKFVWERGCLFRCNLPIKMPVYLPVKNEADAEKMYLRAAEVVASSFKDPLVTYMVERLSKDMSGAPQPVIIRGVDLDFNADLTNIKFVGEKSAQDSDAKKLTCAHFCSKSKSSPELISVENADVIQVSVLLNRSGKSPKSSAPFAEYIPALEEARLFVVDFELEVLCYVAKDLLLMSAISKLIIPALVDQFNSMKKTVLPKLLAQHPQLCSYHFNPPGLLHPITVIYELNYGETELKQVEVRRSLHMRLGLPFDRPLLRIANALDFSMMKDGSGNSSKRKGPSLLKDVHIGIPSSGVSGGVVSLVQGSYEYHHYLQDGFDDSGWGCAYRSLQTIISWFRLQYYTSIDVPSHREIQQALVEIGDKDPSFIGSREWIGAIELSFVLDKLLGVSCKIINVRSGAELPEKCRELALHFENQGTPIMIGGGVLAYTLLGVDYNEVSGDCAFLILDPHYTGNDDHKKIVNGGWCGWKKAVDSKGRNFFLHDKFYNLLLPQRPNMV